MISLFGADYSVYVRSARLALEEKGVAYELVPIDVFAPGGPPHSFLKLNPFGKIPALQHGTLTLYETAAILRYVDEAFTGPPLQPEDASGRARMSQILSILDNHAYRTLVWDIYVERVANPKDGIPADEVRIASATGPARKVLAALENLTEDGSFLLGDALTLADCHAAPMLAQFERAEEGRTLLKGTPKLSRWLEDFRQRAGFRTTEPV